MNKLLDKLRDAVAKLHHMTGPPFGLKFEEMTITMKGPDVETLIHRLEQAQAAEWLKEALEGWQAVWVNTDCEYDDCMPAFNNAQSALAAYTQSASQGEGK